MFKKKIGKEIQKYHIPRLKAPLHSRNLDSKLYVRIFREELKNGRFSTALYKHTVVHSVSGLHI